MSNVTADETTTTTEENDGQKQSKGVKGNDEPYGASDNNHSRAENKLPFTFLKSDTSASLLTLGTNWTFRCRERRNIRSVGNKSSAPLSR